MDRIDLRNAFEDRNEAEVEGILLQTGTTFSVNGLTIDFSRLPAGSIPVPGSRVEVEGSIVGGVLVARKVELEDGNNNEVDVRGEVSSLNSGRKLVVRGLTFNYSGARLIQEGTYANLAMTAQPCASGGTLPNGSGNIEATRIEFTLRHPGTSVRGAPPEISLLPLTFQRAVLTGLAPSSRTHAWGRCRPGSRAARH